MRKLSESSYYSVIGFRDSEGRPLGEGKRSTALAGVPMVLGRCPYPGSRFEHARPMNLSALQQIREHWRACRDLIAWAHGVQGQRGGANHATLSDLWRTARLAQSLPGWLLLRRHDPIADGALSPVVACAFKIVIGVTYALQSLHLHAALDARDEPQAPIAADAVLAHIEDHGLLIGPTQVCAAPRAMIQEVIGLLIDGNPRAALEPALAAAIGDAAGPRFYGAQSMRFQAAGTIVALFFDALTLAVLRVAAPADAPSDALPAPLRHATDHLIAGVPDQPLRRAADLPPDRLVALAVSIRAFMTGSTQDDTPMGAAIARVIDSYRRPRARAEAMLAAFIDTVAGAALPIAPLVPLLATLLALERHWLRLNGIGEHGLETCLGRVAAPRSMADLDRLLGCTALRSWFEATFGLRIAHSEHDVRLVSGAGELAMPAAVL